MRRSFGFNEHPAFVVLYKIERPSRGGPFFGLSDLFAAEERVLPPTASPLPSRRSVAPRWRRTSLCAPQDPSPARDRELGRSSARDIPDLPMSRRSLHP